MLQFLKQQAAFIRQFGTRFETTGSLIPSSRFLARSITRYLQDRGDAAIRVLECGPGTGPFTNRIVRRLRPVVRGRRRRLRRPVLTPRRIWL